MKKRNICLAEADGLRFLLCLLQFFALIVMIEEAKARNFEGGDVCMNVVDIIILAVLGLSVIYGFYRGFVQTVLNVACLLVSVFLAFTFSGQLADAVRSNEGVTSTLATYTDAVARVGDYDLAGSEVSGISESLISKVLESVDLPEPIANILKNNLESQAFAGTSLSTVNDYVSNTVVAVAVNVLCFLVCLFVAYAALSVIVSLIQHVFRFPLLRTLDWLAGGAFGLLRGALLLYALFLVVPVLSTIIPLDAFNETIAQSRFAPFFSSDGFFASVIAGKLF